MPIYSEQSQTMNLVRVSKGLGGLVGQKGQGISVLPFYPKATAGLYSTPLPQSMLPPPFRAAMPQAPFELDEK